MKPRSSVALRSVLTGALLAVAGFTLLPSCSNSNNGAPPVGIADEPVVGEDDPLPGVVVTIQEVRSGAGRGRARVGDLLEVDFTVKTNDGAPLELATFARGAIMVSGPTFNYQRVIASQGDVIDNAVKTALGTYTYRFRVAVPAVYEAPINDTDLLTEGELTGQPLLDGTYTVGIELRKDYRINDVVYRDPGNAAMDFLIGGASAVESREVVTLANCNQCHGELRAHGDNRNNLTNCLLCHTAGAEDKNVATAAGGTPGLTIDFKVMIHKIHAGKHLPSVNGVGTNPDGSRNYGLTPKPYEIVGYGTVDDDGQPIKGNAGSTLHRGVELEASAWLTDVHMLRVAASRSWDEHDDYTTTLDPDTWESGEFDLSGNPIALFPEHFLTVALDSDFGPVDTTLRVRSVGKQYLDNTGLEDRTIDAFTTVDLAVGVDLSALMGPSAVSTRLDLRVNNLLDEEYETWGYWYGGRNLIPAAGRHFLTGVHMSF